jgi:hypothetical protein
MKDYKWNAVFKPLIEKHKPKTFCEIGCHEGLTLKSLTPTTKDLGYKIEYIGYDAFELAIRPTFEYPKNPITNEMEHNGKESASYDVIKERCDKYVNNQLLESYNLIKGWTHDTLIGPLTFDMVYIDGGHSYSTVKWDYEQVKDSKVIIFDDTYPVKFPGVAKFIEELKTSGTPVTELIEKNDNGKVIMQCAVIINEQEIK